jgi:NAD(P)H-nitrite reductase large subunit
LKRYLIIGNSAAGVSAAKSIREIDSQNPITIFSDELPFAYSRPLTSYFLAGKVKKAQLVYKDESFYFSNQIKVVSGCKVSSVNPSKKLVLLEDGRQFSYSKLLIATGASSFLPEIKGIGLEGVYVFRTIEDAEQMVDRAKKSKKAVIVGGGFVGMKAASALADRGLEIEVVIKSKHILSRMLDSQSGKILGRFLSSKGWKFHYQREVVSIEGDESKGVKKVVLDNGKTIDCQMVVIGKGVRPNIIPIEGLKVNKGIVVDEYLQTNLLDIWAAGDVAEVYDIACQSPNVIALWPVANLQGKIAGANMAGLRLVYEGGINKNSIQFYDLPLISVGVVNPRDKGKYEVLIDSEPAQNIYRKILIQDNKVKGAIFLKQIDRVGIITSLVKEQVDVSSFKHLLLASNDFGLIDLPKYLRREKLSVEASLKDRAS